MVEETITLLFSGITDQEIDATNDVLKRVMANAKGADE
jgi:hypothetical protein